MNANAYKNRKGTEIGTRTNFLPYIIILAVVAIFGGIIFFYPHETGTIPATIKETTVDNGVVTEISYSLLGNKLSGMITNKDKFSLVVPVKKIVFSQNDNILATSYIPGKLILPNEQISFISEMQWTYNVPNPNGNIEVRFT